MAANHKLTGVIKGRMIASTSSQGNTLLIDFTDGSKMTIKAAGSTNAASSGTIDKVRQQGTELDLDFEDGSTLKITTAEATSCVIVRDKNGVMDYAD